MKNKKTLLIVVATAIVSLVIAILGVTMIDALRQQSLAESVAVEVVGNDIAANGTVHSVNEATLHFQTGGRLVYLPIKEGDSVSIGQTIAQLDTYPLEQQLSQALNTYQSTRDTFDQTQANAQTGVLQGSQKNNLNLQSQSAIGGGDAETNAINDAVKRIVDQNQANLNNSVIAVQLANYALQLATLSSPFNGIITHEDVTTPYQNVTPVTSFSVADPSLPVFRANVSAHDIDFVQVGALATIHLLANSKNYPATVTKIYPQKQMLPDGEDVYLVDITANGLGSAGILGQNGTVVIKSSLAQKELLVPTWTVVGHNQIWVLQDNQPVLKQITIGNTHGDLVEILHGLNPTDRIVTNPATVAGKKYQLL